MSKLKTVTVSDYKETSFDSTKERETTRSTIALIYVWGFLLIIGLALIGSGILLYFGFLKFNDVKDVVVTLSGVLSGPFGFIIGYYFKAESKND
jgi:hypothetical protein